MSHRVRWPVFIALVLALALIALAGISLATIRRPFPQVDGEINLPGLSGDVEVLRDSWGVAQIYADNAEDLIQAQGFVHAQDRFYEMDVRRHLTAGRLSELFGPDLVETDTTIRTLGWRRVAEAELDRLSPSTRRYLDAYADGVNGYLQSHPPARISTEYSLLRMQGLDYTPEPWTAVDSLAWLKAMAWDLGQNADRELETALMVPRVGASRTAELSPSYPLLGADPIVTSGVLLRTGSFVPNPANGSARVAPAGLADTGRHSARSGAAAYDQAQTYDQALRKVAARLAGLPSMKAPVEGDTGSNSWVVAGSRTTSGKPILANDPHLGLSQPAVFTQNGLHCRVVSKQCPFDVAGFSFAGLPGVVIGHNANVAWGLTNSNVDAQDLYLEELQGDKARVGNGYQPLSVRTEQLKVAGEDQPRTITIRSSRHGPLLSDTIDIYQQAGAAAAGRNGRRATYGVALSWTALSPDRTLDALLRMNTAGDFTEFRAAAALLGAPSQNLVYADRAGNIGYQLAGAVPVRKRGNGDVIAPGWDRNFDWNGRIPFAQLPWIANPRTGYLVAANNQIIDNSYPRHLGSTFSYGWRSQELIDQLKAGSHQTVADNQRLQSDQTARFAAELVPRLLKVKLIDTPTTPASWIAEGQQTLVGWDYSANSDSAAAAYYFAVLRYILVHTFHDEMPSEIWPTGGDRWNAVLTKLLDDPNNRWWDDVNTKDVVEKRDDILRAAMSDARKELTTLISRDTPDWEWGRIHQVTLRHQTLGSSGVGVLEWMFNRGPWPVGGASATVNAMGFDYNSGYQVTSGPVMRMVVDLSDLDHSRWINSTGTSGHVYHQNYDDQTPLWITGDTVDFLTSKAAVEAAAKHRLTLTQN